MRDNRLAAMIVFVGFLLLVTTSTGIAGQKLSTAFRVDTAAGASGSLTKLQALLLQAQWTDAAKLAASLTKQFPANPHPFYALGLAEWRMDNPIGTIQALRSAEKLGLDTDTLHKLLGMAYYRVNQYDLFRLEMEKAIHSNPQGYAPYYFLGLYYLSDVGNAVKALKFLDNAVARSPDDAKSVYYRGYCREVLNLRSKAQVDYRRSIALAKKHHKPFSLPYQSMATLFLRSNPDLAAHYAKKAVQINPQLDTNYFTLSEVEEHLGHLRKAVTSLQMAAKLNPTDSSYHYVLWRLYSRMHKALLAHSEMKTFEKLSRLYGTGQ